MPVNRPVVRMRNNHPSAGAAPCDHCQRLRAYLSPVLRYAMTSRESGGTSALRKLRLYQRVVPLRFRIARPPDWMTSSTQRSGGAPQSYGVMCFTTLKRACSVPRIPAGRELFCEFTHLGLSSPVAMQSLDLFAKCAYPSHTFSFVCGLVRAVVLLSHVL